MRLIKVKAENFASYQELELELGGQGLCLIQGPTGAGKSTVLDAVSWGLYGQGAKDLNADDVKPWGAKASTTVCVEVATNAGILKVFRSRTPNDLYWVESGVNSPIRGKDLSDTQQLLNKRLGVDFERFVASSYFHEFSPTNQFFVSNAKQRRSIFERVADLSLPMKLAERTQAAKKEIKKVIVGRQDDVSVLKGRITALEEAAKRLYAQKDKWFKDKELKKQELTKHLNLFEEGKATRVKVLTTAHQEWEEGNILAIATTETKLSKLNTSRELSEGRVCPTCKRKDSPHVDELAAAREYATLSERRKALYSAINPHAQTLADAKGSINTYAQQLSALSAQECPIDDSDTIFDLQKAHAAAAEAVRTLTVLLTELSNLDTLYDISYDLRAAILGNAVSLIQEITNTTLEKYFEAELRLEMALEGADSLKLTVQKNGNECSYKQLSKGQRGLLRLCFSNAMMQATANQAGTHFDTLMFDEALDGLDTELKLKAFRMFEDLSNPHGTVLVVDHCEELKERFSRRFSVTMTDNGSMIGEV